MEPCECTASALSLLYVEDDEFARKIACKLISLGFPELVIHQAENGKMGLECFKEHAPDIVVSDINMPVMDGIQMAREIKSLSHCATIIIVTAHNDKSYLDNIGTMGIAHFVAKPIDHKKLFAAIADCCTTIGMAHKR
ncbi:MAG TPA: response regulator [Desulfuromonadaceae bacterium]